MTRARELADLLTGGQTISTDGNTAQLTLESTDADASLGPLLAMHRNSASPADSDVTGKIEFNGEDSAGNATVYASINSSILDVTNGTEDGELKFEVRKDGSNTETLTLKSEEVVLNEGSADIDFRVESNDQADMFFVDAGNNRIGIGTDAPVNTLDVIDNGGGAAVVGRIRNEGGAAGDDATLELSIATASEEMRVLFTDSSGTAGQIVVDGGDNSMAFETGTSEAMRIDTNGNLLLGQTSTTQPGLSNTTAGLGINNTGRIFSSVNGAWSFFNRNNDNGQVIGFGRDGTAVGGIEVFASSTSFNTSSDYRLKENVADMTGAIDRVKALAPKRFNFIKDADTTVDGFLAHEAQTVVPEAVTGTHNGLETWTQREIDDGEAPDSTSAGDNKLDRDGNTIPKMQGIDQSKLVPLLTGALKEAIAKIETLETKVAALEAE